jgi:cob(I)alamin adenosyltransferase
MPVRCKEARETGAGVEEGRELHDVPGGVHGKCSDNPEKGLVLVYTGNGKGKTTAALGLGLRAVGQGLRVFMVQFMKSPKNAYGETKAIRELMPQWILVQSGREGFVQRPPSDEDIRLAEEGYEISREALTSGEYDLVILDEINVAVYFGLLEARNVVKLVNERRPGVHVVLTGRYAPKEILDLADTVSEICEVKHHYNKGIKAIEGIEF